MHTPTFMAKILDKLICNAFYIFRSVNECSCIERLKVMYEH